MDEEKQLNPYWYIIPMIGGGVMIVCLFLSWEAFSINRWVINVSGLDFFRNIFDGNTVAYSAFAKYAPMIATLCGLMTMLCSTITFYFQRSPLMPYLATAFALIGFVAVLLFFIKATGSAAFTDGWEAFYTNIRTSYGIGSVLSLIGSIASSIGGFFQIREFRSMSD